MRSPHEVDKGVKLVVRVERAQCSVDSLELAPIKVDSQGIETEERCGRDARKRYLVREVGAKGKSLGARRSSGCEMGEVARTACAGGKIAKVGKDGERAFARVDDETVASHGVLRPGNIG